MSGDSVRTVLVGNRELARHVLTHICDTGWNVVGAVAPSGEAAIRQAGYVPFDELANAHSIELIETTDINDRETKRRLAALEPELCICPGWHQIIDEEVLQIPARAFVGFHASDLPFGRGGAPVNWAILHGQSEVTISLFHYSDGVDAGDVIRKQEVVIEPRDDVDTILDKLAIGACEILDEIQGPLQSGNLTAMPQSISEATYRPRRQPQDGIIDWSRSATDISNWVRAQTDPYPGAYTFHLGRRLTVWRGAPLQFSNEGEAPGTVISIEKGEGIDVAAGDAALRVKRLQPADSPRMWADDFARYSGLAVGDTFGRQQAPSSWLYTGIRDSDGGTDFSAASNLHVGEPGEVLAVVRSASDHEVDINASFDGDPICEEETAVDGCETVSIAYTPETPGTHTLCIEFSEEGEGIDVRYLKVFASMDS